MGDARRRREANGGVLTPLPKKSAKISFSMGKFFKPGESSDFIKNSCRLGAIEFQGFAYSMGVECMGDRLPMLAIPSIQDDGIHVGFIVLEAKNVRHSGAVVSSINEYLESKLGMELREEVAGLFEAWIYGNA